LEGVAQSSTAQPSYTKGKTLGRGAYGEVFRVNYNGRPSDVAVEIIPIAGKIEDNELVMREVSRVHF